MLGLRESSAYPPQAALEENPKSEEVLSNLASVYTKQNKYEDAARIFRELLKLDN